MKVNINLKPFLIIFCYLIKDNKTELDISSQFFLDWQKRAVRQTTKMYPS